METLSAAALPTRSLPKFSPIDLTGPWAPTTTDYNTHPKLSAALAARQPTVLSLASGIAALQGNVASLHAHEGGFTTIGRPAFNAAVRPSKFPTRHQSRMALPRSGSETHVSPQGASM